MPEFSEALKSIIDRQIAKHSTTFLGVITNVYEGSGASSGQLFATVQVANPAGPAHINLMNRKIPLPYSGVQQAKNQYIGATVTLACPNGNLSFAEIQNIRRLKVEGELVVNEDYRLGAINAPTAIALGR